MIAWIPFTLLSLGWLYLLWRASALALSNWQKVTIISCLIYLLAICYLCFTPTQYNWGGPHKTFYYLLGVPCNLIPFQAFSPDFFMNIVMTIPAGVYWYLMVSHTSFKNVLIGGLFLGFGIESCQFILDLLFHVERFVDIDDVITNALGVFVGFYVMVLFNQTLLKPWIDQLKVKFAKL